MKNHLSFAVTLLVAAMLACSLPGIDLKGTEKNLSYTKILSLAVIPPSGRGNFTLEVNYEWFNSYRLEKKPNSIVCVYSTPDAVAMPIGNIYTYFREEPDYMINTRITRKDKLPFSVKQADGVAKPGEYLVGCSIPDEGTLDTAAFTVVEDKTLAVTITNVTVTPASGSGSFTLEVNFEVEEYDKNIPDYVPEIDSIHCYYLTPNGATMAIGDFTPLVPFSETKWSDVFTATQPGSYTAGCQTGELNSEKTALFKVVEQTVATESLTLPQPSPIQVYIEFDHNKETFTPHLHNHGIMDFLHEMCAPLIFIKDNTMTGECDVTDGDPSTANVPGDHTQGAKIHGALQGQVGSDGIIHFTYTLTSKYEPDSEWWSTKEIVFESTGKFTSGTTAEGTATYKYSCAGGHIEANSCGTSDVLSKSDSFTGTIPWKFVSSQ